MGYYDNVKDNVRGKEGSNSNKPSFDTLKEAAEETSNESDKEEGGDDTPIEVLEEGGLQDRQQQRQVQQSQSQSSSGSVQSGSQNVSHGSKDVDLSSLEDKMDKMIEQNQRMIEILESFGQ